ncbi:MAG: hypothetical protein KGJ13_01010 [Patescibacteria group bacterium]|nr:hypothetical protein [Patescibacteria group bacterium]
MNRKGFAPIVVLLIMVGILVVGGVGYYAFRNNAIKSETSQATINWTQQPYEIKLFPGTVKVVDLHFITSHNLSAPSLYISPSLSRYLTFANIGSGTLFGNEQATLRARFTIPDSIPPGTYSGAVQIKNGGSDIEQPLTVTIHVEIPSNKIIPQETAFPSPDRIMTTAGGATMVKDEIDVMLADNTSNPDETIRAIATATNGLIIGSVPNGLTYQLKYNVSNINDLQQIQAKIKRMSHVEDAIFSVFGGLN